MVHERVDQDIKRILIEIDITTLKQAFCRIMCAEIQNSGTRVFVPDRLFLQNRLQSYLSDKELQLGRQLLEMTIITNDNYKNKFMEGRTLS
jgi:hypothetical protein